MGGHRYSETVTGMASTPDNHGQPAASTPFHFPSPTPAVSPSSAGVGPKRSARRCNFWRSKLYTDAAFSPRIRRASSTGQSQKVSRSHWRVWGHVPSGWGKSLPHMMFPTPISKRRAISRRRVLDDPMKTLRSKYSLGSIFNFGAMSPIFLVACSFMYAMSDLHKRSAAHHDPPS